LNIIILPKRKKVTIFTKRCRKVSKEANVSKNLLSAHDVPIKLIKWEAENKEKELRDMMETQYQFSGHTYILCERDKTIIFDYAKHGQWIKINTVFSCHGLKSEPNL
jgi:hypothetical protein